ncbi:MAG: hypothetical protein JXR37_22045 [Kiritimatiellae bacterium]|nr:hypothetical protein [Kiritimatiellia bacterium]
MSKTVSALILCAGLACLGGAGRLNRGLLQTRAGYGLSAADPLESSPPMVAFTTVALGGFRGLLADALWVRAARLQDEGKYFEIVQLADWITKLEPRFTPVWAFHAWNMSYNISVMFPDHADRWRWVMNGIRLLRDEGIRANPGDPALYWELGWFFQHKVGGITDDAAPFYQRRWAEEMAELLGNERPDWDALAASPAAEQLRTRYRLRVAIMREADRLYGPLDWRLPQAHAVYWAWRGQRLARAGDALACRRMIFQAMSESFLRGALVFDRERNLFVTLPNIDILPNTLKAYEEALREHDTPAVRTAYANFLQQAVLVVFSFNRPRQARELFERLRTRFPDTARTDIFERFVYAALKEALRDAPAAETAALVEGHYYQSYFWLAVGREDRAGGYEQLAVLIWTEYMRGLPADARERAGLPPLPTLRAQALRRAARELPAPGLRERLKPLLATP